MDTGCKPDQGFGLWPLTAKAIFPVLQMSCASIAISVQTILQKQNGVINANVNFLDGHASIEYFPELIQLLDFQKAVRFGGYELLINQGNDSG